jgi:hypothetical protein
MLLVGLAFIPLGVTHYPLFILVGVFYVVIGLRGFIGPKPGDGLCAESDKTEFESL